MIEVTDGSILENVKKLIDVRKENNIMAGGSFAPACLLFYTVQFTEIRQH